MTDMKDVNDPYETPQNRSGQEHPGQGGTPRPPEQAWPHADHGEPAAGDPAVSSPSAGDPAAPTPSPAQTPSTAGSGSAGISATPPTDRLDPYTPADAPGSARPWSPAWEDRDRFGYPATFGDPYGSAPSGGSTGPTGPTGSTGPGLQGAAASTGPSPTAATAATGGPPGSPRRRGPGWGGVAGLVALGLLVSSGFPLGGGVADGQLLSSDSTSTAQEAPPSSADASPASVSTVDDPDWASVAEQVSPSAVAIEVSTGGGTAQGTGVMLDEDGSILTNNHVVQDARAVQVTMSDGLSYTASIVGTDPNTDLAVIRMDSPPEDLQPATFADSSTVAVGQPVMALGTPLGLENTVTTGIISAVDRPVSATGEAGGSQATYTSAIQTDAAINPGNSGGPLVDAAGQVIGINSSIAGIPNASGQAGSIGLGFAIPANTATMIAEQLQEDGSADHAFMGVTSTDGTATLGDVAHHGAQVVSVEPGSPAAEAGLRTDDLITGIDDTDVGGAAALTGIVRGMEVDSEHTLTVVRGQDQQTREITLGSSPS
ncbi:MAG: trypsin-like peptidase domain-containing protein [Brachybacterium sp.]|uniref:trypsin-like peptidase domain-containing protein n=1 Tax=Brachybacterium sp. TaxID=1891286 RepID=UPI00264764BB|nr:trypsin-like peptidase domain-containing protein [Brachybacterium sp.]MDN5686819.1 trypsin-like peptidase domain-containing protein [Brachybacterium sp.]